MSIIEQRISKNKKAFDVHEPGEGHFERFQDKLQKLHPGTESTSKKRIMPAFLKVVAAALILLAVSSIVFNYPSLFSKEITYHINTELLELDQYYVSENQRKLQEIENIVSEDTEMQAIKDKAMHNVERLQDNTTKLKEEYLETNKNEKVYSALVTNYRMLSTALDKVINSMSEIKYKKSTN